MDRDLGVVGDEVYQDRMAESTLIRSKCGKVEARDKRFVPNRKYLSEQKFGNSLAKSCFAISLRGGFRNMSKFHIAMSDSSSLKTITNGESDKSYGTL
jgi:hypothetical protein